MISYDTIEGATSDLTIESGAIGATDWRAVVDIGSVAGGCVAAFSVSMALYAAALPRLNWIRSIMSAARFVTRVISFASTFRPSDMLCIAASARIVASLPSVITFACPSGSTISAESATSPLLAYSDFCSKNSTGSGSRIAAASSPITSCGLEGAITLRPGTAIAQFSTDCECCAPNRTPAPLAARITRGNETWPSDM